MPKYIVVEVESDDDNDRFGHVWRRWLRHILRTNRLRRIWHLLGEALKLEKAVPRLRC